MQEERPEPEHLVQSADPSRERDRGAGPVEQVLDPGGEVRRAEDLIQVLVRGARVCEPVQRAPDHAAIRRSRALGHTLHDPRVSTTAHLGAPPGQGHAQLVRQTVIRIPREGPATAEHDDRSIRHDSRLRCGNPLGRFRIGGARGIDVIPSSP